MQTLAPEAAAIRHAAAHDATGFLAGEFSRRCALSYPPFSSVARIELTGPDAGAVRAASERVREALEGSLPRGTELLGPAPRFRLRGRHRRQLLLKAQERTATVAATREALERLSARRELGSVALSVDVDPQ